MSIENQIDYSYKFRLYPTKEQEVKLAQHFGCVRWVYNYFLERRNKFYLNAKEKNLEKKRLYYMDDCKDLTGLKKQNTWLSDCCAQSLQHSLKHLEAGFNRFFKKSAKFPKFKSRRARQSFRIPQGVRIKNKKLHITKFKEGINIRLHRSIEGAIRNATVSKNSAGQYFASIGVRRHINKYPKLKTQVGIDLGIKSLATCSNGKTFPNLRIYRGTEKRRRLLQKAWTRAKGEKGREKTRRKLAKFDLWIANKRLDHLHKVSHQIVSENQTIVMEDLNIGGMMKNRKISKSLADCSLYELVRQITYKASWYGREFIQVNRWYPSSKTCGKCGFINDGLTLKDREWDCPRCNAHHDRDRNSSDNILRQGLHERNRTSRTEGIAVCPDVRLSSGKQLVGTETKFVPRCFVKKD